MEALLNFITYRTPIFYLIQSVWRDEAFSYFMSKPSVFKIIPATANDFNPPLYYLVLHFWIYIAGNSDILLRMLSFIFHLVGVYFAFLLGRKLNGKNQAFYLAIFYLLNPMLLYYAFEIRMYSLYAMLATAAIYFFYVKNWKGYIISAALGLYSHSFFVLLIASLGFYNFVHKNLKRDFLNTFKPLLLFLPWIPVLAIQFAKSKESWLFPVDLQLIKSALGNLFTSYEGTPGHYWQYTFYLSVAILAFMFLSFKNRKLRGDMFIYPTILPLLVILTYSVIKRPLYVNRYLIFITVFEVISIFAGILSIKSPLIRKTAAVLWIAIAVYFNIYLPPFRKKTDFKSTFAEINKIAKPEDQVYTRTPIAFLESAYYFRDPAKVYVYNPLNIHIPSYIGVNVLFPEASRSELPMYPSRVFMVSDSAGFDIVINSK